MDGGREANDPAGRRFGSALFLVQTGMPGWGVRRMRFFGARWSNRETHSEQQRGGKTESFHGGHDMCPRRAAVNPP